MLHGMTTHTGEEQKTSPDDLLGKKEGKLETFHQTKQFKDLADRYQEITELKSPDAFARRTALDKLMDRDLLVKLSSEEDFSDFYEILGEAYQQESDPWNRRHLIRQLKALVENPVHHEVLSKHFLNALHDQSPIVRGEVAQCLGESWTKLFGSPVERDLLLALLAVADKDEDQLTQGYALSAVKKYALGQKKTFVSLRHFTQSLDLDFE